jgi:MtrB/PioB family decaheme-associated outer membrane protein
MRRSVTLFLTLAPLTLALTTTPVRADAQETPPPPPPDSPAPAPAEPGPAAVPGTEPQAAPAQAATAKPAETSELTGTVVVGGQGLDENPPNAAKFFEYRDVPSGFVAESVHLDWRPHPRSFMNVEAYDIAQQDSRGAVTFGTVDHWGGQVFWNQNPRHWGDHPRQLWSEHGDATFNLDDNLQAAVQAAPAAVDTTPADGQWDAGTKGAIIKTAINQSAQNVALMSERKVMGAALSWNPVRNWTVGVDATRETRQGTAPQSLGNYFALAPGEVATPVDFRTDWANLHAEYQQQNFNVGGSVGVSKFQTGYTGLTWDDQLSLTDQAAVNTPGSAITSIPGTERLLLATDNDALTATVFGGVNLPGRTRIDATVSATDVTQDDPFLPMTTNTQLQPLLNLLPQESFDGEHRYSLLNVRASGRPTKTIRWGAWARQYELKNDSPSLSFPEYVATDYEIPLCGNAASCGATTNTIARRSLPYAYEKDTYGGLVGWKPLNWFDSSLSYEQLDTTRKFSAVDSSQENHYKATLDFDAGEQVTIRATAHRYERRADEYDAEYNLASFPIGEAAVAAANEGERKFIWTDRDRDQYGLQLEWSPNERLSLYAEGLWAHDQYLDPTTGRKIGESVVEGANTILLAGRTFDRDQSYSVGVSYHAAKRFDVYGDFTWEKWEYELASRYRNVTAGVGTDNPLDDWSSTADDEYRTATAGFRMDLDKKQRWKLDVHGSWSRGTGDLSTDFVPGGSSSGDTTLTQFPQLKNTLTIATAQLTHDVRKNFSYVFRYWYEQWHENNWASDFMQPYMGDPGNDPGSVNAIYLGYDFNDYTYQVVSAFLRYTF